MNFSEMARDPNHQRRLEVLLYLAAQRGDADLVAERLSWGADPDCRSKKKKRTPLIANVVSCCPSAAIARALVAAGADPHASDVDGLTALDVARRKLAKIASTGYEPTKSPSLDENDQLQLPEWEREELDKTRARLGDGPEAREFVRIWWQERLRAARRRFNDPVELERIVALLEPTAGAPRSLLL
jgi:hypothetical protein